MLIRYTIGGPTSNCLTSSRSKFKSYIPSPDLKIYPLTRYDVMSVTRYTELFVGVTVLITISISLIGNTVALFYFLSYRRKASALSYIFLSFNDLILLLLLLPVQLHQLLGPGIVLPWQPSLCTTWAVLWKLSRGMTHFSVMWILVCRFSTLVSQFRYLRPGDVILPTVVYGVLLAGQTLIPVVTGASCSQVTAGYY